MIYYGFVNHTFLLSVFILLICRCSSLCVCVFQVVLKIIKHYQEEGQGSEVVQGVLLGLVVEDRLEITNCFPFPQHNDDDADFDEGEELKIHCINKLLVLLFSKVFRGYIGRTTTVSWPQALSYWPQGH